jgi:hypothetical protein
MKEGKRPYEENIEKSAADIQKPIEKKEESSLTQAVMSEEHKQELNLEALSFRPKIRTVVDLELGKDFRGQQKIMDLFF